MDQHDPLVIPMADVADRWVVRCDCGCGVYEQYPTREQAEERADQARADGPPSSDRDRVIEEVHAEQTDPI